MMSYKFRKQFNTLENKVAELEAIIKDELYKDFMRNVNMESENQRLKKENKMLRQKNKAFKELFLEKGNKKNGSKKNVQFKCS